MFSCSPYSQWCTVLTKNNSLGRWSLLWLFSLFDWTQSRLIFFLAFCFLDSPCVMWSDKQLIQYTSCPLLAFLDGCNPPPEVDLGTGSSTSSSNIHVQPSSSSDASVEAEPPSELLDTSLESKQRARSSLIRLEPLTEAEASEETLFYLCKLSPAEPEANSTQLDKLWAGTELVTFMPHTLMLVHHRLFPFILHTVLTLCVNTPSPLWPEVYACWEAVTEMNKALG